MEKLLTRNEFKKAVFNRDKFKCVFCEEDAVDAHHIMERRLWGKSQGYYLNNGASVCSIHHLDCEMTVISTSLIREYCNINIILLPEHLYPDQEYDKWGNIIISENLRLKGELFNDISVRKILRKGKVLDLFSDKVKYPRTFHLPWSPGLHDDDKMMSNFDFLKDKRVIVPEKMDGENTTMYYNNIHARSIDSSNHLSRNWVKNFWSKISYDIPIGWRICGENMYAEHSIKYNKLESYFYGFSIWNELNECLSWDDTIEWFSLLGITPVPILYDGIFDIEKIKKATEGITNDLDNHEGYIVRVADKFSMLNFKVAIGKYVRKDHIKTTKHWMRGQRVFFNKLK